MEGTPFVTPNPNQGKDSAENTQENPLSNNLVQVELYLCNGKPFDELIQRADAKVIWTEILDLKLADLKAYDFKRIPKRCLRINYLLNKSVKVVDLHDTPDFKVQLDKSYYSGRILGFNDVKPAKRGDEVKVTVLYAYPEVPVVKIARWLEVFGDVIGDPTHVVDEDKIESGQVQFKLILEHHIPEFLPIYGTKARIFYAGMPRQCGRCYKQGHIKSGCPNVKVGWPTYISKLMETGAYRREWFGSWIEEDQPKRCRSPGDIATAEKRRRIQSPKRNAKDDRGRRDQGRRDVGRRDHHDRKGRRTPEKRRSRSPDRKGRRRRSPSGRRHDRRSRSRSRSPRRSHGRKRSRSPRHERSSSSSPECKRKEPLEERDLRNWINDKDLREEYQQFKEFQMLKKLREQAKEPKEPKRNPYPGETSKKRTADARSGSPSAKKKKPEREVFINKIPAIARLGKRIDDSESPWIPRKPAAAGAKAKPDESDDDDDIM
jgi:hypothetical protein